MPPKTWLSLCYNNTIENDKPSLQIGTDTEHENQTASENKSLCETCFFSMIVLSPLFVFRPSMFCDGVLFPVVLVANAGPDMGHHGSFLTVCPLDQPDYSRNSQDLFQKNQKAVFLKDKTPTEIESKLLSPMTLQFS